MSLFGVELNHQLNRIITDIRLTLQKQKFIPNARTLYRSFAHYDDQVSGTLTPNHFEKGLNQNGIFLKKVDVQALEKGFSNQEGYINWFYFLQALRIPLNQLRKTLVSNIFDFLSESSERLTPEVLGKLFNSSDVQLVKSGKIKKQYLENQLISLIPMPDGHVTKQQFIAFYDDLNLNFPHDQPFVKYVSLQWNYSPASNTVASKEAVKEIIRSLRFKLIQKSKGTNDQFLLKKLFNEYDDNKNGYISAFQLDLMLKKLQLPIQQKFIEPLFKILDKNNSGAIEYEEFKRFIFFDPYPS